jgi:anti-anti-sigma factor
MTGGEMTISRDESDGVEIIRLEGDVDLTNAELVREAVEATTAERVVLDLSGVTFLDSVAISTLDGGQRQLAAEHRSLMVVSPPETPSAWTLRVMGMDDVVCESLDDALVATLVRRSGS